MLILVVLVLAAGPATAAASDARDSEAHTDLINQFFAVMTAEGPPTIEQFDHLFGPHNEDELTLQLRLAGSRHPLTEMASDELVARVNRRLLAPKAHASLYLCMLRREMPGLRTSTWELMEIVREPEIADVYRVRTPGAVLAFSFPVDEQYIGRLLDEAGAFITAERFLPSCQPGSCCVTAE